MPEITRRNFVKSAIATGAAACSIGAITASASEIEWADEATMVIVGGGAAGYAAAATAGVEGLGDTILLEAAPEELEGGNSRVCGQGVFCPRSVEGAITYQTAMNDAYAVPEDVMRAWAENICENVDWLTEVCGFEAVEKGGAEFPELPGSDEAVWYAHQGKGPWGHTWQLVKDAAMEYDTRVYFEARAVELITNEAGEVIGVQTEDGRNFKAKKGVILACGGFEANQEMMNAYLEIGFSGCRPRGTWFNRGDGIKMAQELGADLWHMNNTSNAGYCVQTGSVDDTLMIQPVSFGTTNYIWICSDGTRFVNEAVNMRHGKMWRAGTWCTFTMPAIAWAVMDQACFDERFVAGASAVSARTDAIHPLQSNQELLEAGIITKCDDLAALSAATGIPEENLSYTLERWNGFCENQADLDFIREVPVDTHNPAYLGTGTGGDHQDVIGLGAIEPPYYIFKLIPSLLNTQGGPRKNAEGAILKPSGKVIPRLFSAGEMGCIYSFMYNLGGNFSEAISSGRVAARSCGKLDAWE